MNQHWPRIFDETSKLRILDGKLIYSGHGKALKEGGRVKLRWIIVKYLVRVVGTWKWLRMMLVIFYYLVC